MDETSKQNIKVTFRQGCVTDQLANPNTPRAEIVTISYGSRHLGFLGENIGLLASYVEMYLITIGDNGNIENQPWFLDTFRQVSHNKENYSYVWEKKGKI